MTPLIVLLTLAANPVEFEFRDVEAVDGRTVVRFRPVELGASPVRPLKWDGPAPPDVRYGLANVGPTPDSAPAVAWARESRALWVDADGDGRLRGDERHTLEPGSTVAVAATIAARGATGPSPGPSRRTLLFRTGLLGEGPRYAVRGAMSGTLELGARRVLVLLTDGNADGCFDDNRADRAWVDLDGDGRFDPVTEQFPLGTPIAVAGTSYTIASDPWGRAVAAHERDTRKGQLRLGLREGGPGGAIASLAADLVSDTGELVTIRTPDAAQEATVGRYRIASFVLEMADESGRVWSYTFNGGRRYAIAVEPGRTTHASLLEGLRFEVVAVALGGARPGDDVDVTPSLRLGSGLYLASCATKIQGSRYELPRSAQIVLKSPDGKAVDLALSGFS